MVKYGLGSRIPMRIFCQAKTYDNKYTSTFLILFRLTKRSHILPADTHAPFTLRLFMSDEDVNFLIPEYALPYSFVDCIMWHHRSWLSPPSVNSFTSYDKFYECTWIVIIESLHSDRSSIFRLHEFCFQAEILLEVKTSLWELGKHLSIPLTVGASGDCY